MSWLAAVPVLGQLFTSLGEAIDRNVTTDHERLQMKAKIMELQVPVIMAVAEAHKAGLDLQAKLAEVEAKSEDRLVRWRRPIVSIVALANFLVMSWLGAMGYPIPDLQYAFILAALANGLDIGTRGLEKMVGRWSDGKQ